MASAYLLQLVEQSGLSPSSWSSTVALAAYEVNVGSILPADVGSRCISDVSFCKQHRVSYESTRVT
jgi:hypothetical protein